MVFNGVLTPRTQRHVDRMIERRKGWHQQAAISELNLVASDIHVKPRDFSIYRTRLFYRD
jgi:hypothetical protein